MTELDGSSALRGPSLRLRAHLLAALPLLALVIAIAVSTTTGVGIGGSWFDEHRIISTAAFVVAVLYLGSMFFKRQDTWAHPVVVAAMALGLASSLVAGRPYLAIVEWSIFILILLFALGQRVLDAQTVALAGAAFGSIVAVAYVTGVAANYVSELLLGFEVGYQTLLVGFSNPRFPAQLEALSIPFLFLAYRLAPSRFWKTWLCVAAAGWWMCLIGSGSRTSWVSVAVALFAVAWLERHRGFAFTRFQTMVAALGGAAYLFFFIAVPHMFGLTSAPESGRFTELSSMQVRLFLWSDSLEAIAANPLLGVGPMHYAYAYNAEAAHPHNFWLQLAVEWGLPVALAALTGFVLLWKRVFEVLVDERDLQRHETGLVLLAALTVWFVGTQADGFMVVPTSQLATAIILALCVSYVRLNHSLQIEATKPGAAFRFVWAGMATLALSTLAYLPFSSFGNATEREALWRKERKVHYFHPRFWQQGWIGPDQDPTAR